MQHALHFARATHVARCTDVGRGGWWVPSGLSVLAANSLHTPRRPEGDDDNVDTHMQIAAPLTTTTTTTVTFVAFVPACV